MNKKRVRLAEPSKLVPPFILEILDAPALVGSESSEDFYHMLSGFVVEFSPGATSEWLLVWDLVNVNFEMKRYRRMKATLIKIESQAAKDHIIRRGVTRGHLRIGLLRTGASLPETKTKETDELLAASGFNINDVADAAALLNFKQMTQIETLLERLEIRREKLFRELQAHKAFSITTATAASEEFIEESLVIEQ